MEVTFDTNTRASIISAMSEPYITIENLISDGVITPYVSEATLKLESMKNDSRVDEYIRSLIVGPKITEEIDNEKIQIKVEFSAGSSHPTSVDILEKTLRLGFKILRAPRIAYPPFVGIPDKYYAKDQKYSPTERHDRFCLFGRRHDAKGPIAIERFGLELCELHDLKSNWELGLVSEYDNPKLGDGTRGHFLSMFRRIISEWTDMDSLASVYAYGIEYFCTQDISSDQGEDGILHPSNRERLTKDYGIIVISPADLLQQVDGS